MKHDKKIKREEMEVVKKELQASRRMENVEEKRMSIWLEEE